MPLLAVLFVGLSASLLFLGLAWIYGIGVLVLLAVPLAAIAVYYADSVNRRTWLRRWWHRATFVPFSAIALFGWLLGGIPDVAPRWLKDVAAVMLHQWHLAGGVPGTWATAGHMAGERLLYAWFASLEFAGGMIGLELTLDLLDLIVNALLGGHAREQLTGKAPEREADLGKAGVVDDLSA